MSDLLYKSLVTAVLVMAVVGAILFDAMLIAQDRYQRGTRDIPQCPEDAVLVGTGSFENGRWTDYVCGPAVDDYQP